ncbi:MAG: AAA family ATPase, partial [Clostridiales bacterium]|nr:AAA family ATPase [Clostridiales bacterium]
MEYITRSLEGKFLKMSRFFKVVLVTGARQVGKTTMLMHLAEYGQRTYVTLDNLMIRNLAKTDPALFFQTYKPPILIDEIQYAPELFGHIKLMCDESEETGRFWLSSSQRYSMIKDVHETLAGRLCVLDLHSLSRNEIQGVAHEGSLDFSLSALLERQRQSQKQDLPALYDEIWRGGMPQMQLGDTDARDAYYESYIDTHLMRDVTQIGGVTDAVKFRKFL